jgi:hypothetical protein
MSTDLLVSTAARPARPGPDTAPGCRSGRLQVGAAVLPFLLVG